ncbi:MAG: type II toxin-antitoxin system HicB family antitoxin [Gemmataceae bacterium]|nr:type II toxin-antitoxin system HicB family antitoxin [Gemmataceae bacterium]
MRFLIRIYRYGEDYSAMVPDLPGCVAAAESVEKVRKLITEAVGLHLELMRESGEKVPTPSPVLNFAIDETTEEKYGSWIEVAEGEPVLAARATSAAAKPKTQRKQR